MIDWMKKDIKRFTVLLVLIIGGCTSAPPVSDATSTSLMEVEVASNPTQT